MNIPNFASLYHSGTPYWDSESQSGRNGPWLAPRSTSARIALRGHHTSRSPFARPRPGTQRCLLLSARWATARLPPTAKMRYRPGRPARQRISEHVEDAYGSPSYTNFALAERARVPGKGSPFTVWCLKAYPISQRTPVAVEAPRYLPLQRRWLSESHPRSFLAGRRPGPLSHQPRRRHSDQGSWHTTRCPY